MVPFIILPLFEDTILRNWNPPPFRGIAEDGSSSLEWIIEVQTFGHTESDREKANLFAETGQEATVRSMGLSSPH
jgi:hypothetical protein